MGTLRNMEQHGYFDWTVYNFDTKVPFELIQMCIAW